MPRLPLLRGMTNRLRHQRRPKRPQLLARARHRAIALHPFDINFRRKRPILPLHECYVQMQRSSRDRVYDDAKL